ncbi:MAG: 1-(5-phosphoribosyl)-5-[(5-phosphoribosylamino)methylideneamino]imidazole-4-carboxamide isomerase [Thermodesulfobacteriota bacterium]
MIVIPAIDIKDGKCVRLRQGKMDSSTIFNDDPPEQARKWEALGASRIHVVDLNGSVGGKPVNLDVVGKIAAAVPVPVQLGGGVRDRATAAVYLDMGVDRVIVGTMAAKEPEKARDLISEFPGRIAIGIDALRGWVAVQGWTESTSVKASDLAAQFDAHRPAAFIYTDIERDGMMQGPNVAATREFAESTSTPVILSGGVSALEDVRKALALEKFGIVGIIIGRALYDGKIDLKEAIALTEKRDAR